MIRHVVSFRFKENILPAEQGEYAQMIKTALEALKEVVPGVCEFTVYTDLLESSNHDILFDSTFVSEQALADYQQHPKHVEILDLIKKVMTNRTCVDYLI